jgi:hypothetical protein
MTPIQDAAMFGLNFIADHPEHAKEVNDLYVLMKNEIEEGGSVENEISLFKSSCENLLEDEEDN